MRKTGRKEAWDVSRALVLLLLAVCLTVTVFFRQRFYGEMEESAIGWDTEAEEHWIEGIDGNTVLRQVFYPERGILNYIYVAVGGHGQTGTMTVALLDREGQQAAVREIPCSQMVERGAQGVPFHIRVEAGEEYSYTVTFQDVEDEYPSIQTAVCVSEGDLGTLYVDGEPSEECIFGLFVTQEYYLENTYWRLCLLMTVLLAGFLLLYPRVPIWRTRLLPLFLAFHTVLSVIWLETIAGTDFTAWGRRRFLYNCLLCGLIYIVLSVFIWNGRAVLVSGTAACLLLGVAQYYVLEFRGTPLVLADLRSAGTAAEVSGTYVFDVPAGMTASVLTALGVLLLESKIAFRKYRLPGRMVYTCLLLLWGAGSFWWLKNRPILNTGRNGGFFWDLSKSYGNYGFFLSTYIYESYQVVEKPADYSRETVEMLTEYPEEETGVKETFPNIIVIMNESFTDFAGVGGLETSGPVTPFMDSLEENTVKGKLYVSVFGGGTANTEFEFLTGSTMHFLPSGSTPYQAYIREELPSLASYLKKYGYSTAVCHLANRRNWNRDKAYPLLGFDTYISEEDVGELETIHGYPSDAANYQEVLKLYEAWKEEGASDHFFCFNVTIQNHGGYTSGYRSENAPRYTGGRSWEDVDEYLSLLYESDQAFGELVRYFEAEEEPAILLMFGDHWPRLNGSFINSAAGRAEVSGALEKNQNKYVTPFLLWANYDIGEKEIEKLSVNYLSSLLLKTAGIPRNGYQQFLERLAGEVPVVNSLGLVDASGTYYSDWEEMSGEAAELLADYEILQYANLFGKEDTGTFFR